MISQNEMSNFIDEYCEEQGWSCTDCVVEEFCDPICGAFEDPRYESVTRKAYERLLHNQDESEDVVKHPNHYCREGAMECIDEMVQVFGVEAVKHFAICNVWKYRYRSADKNGTEDIAKSDEYMRIYKRLCDEYRN